MWSTLGTRLLPFTWLPGSAQADEPDTTTNSNMDSDSNSEIYFDGLYEPSIQDVLVVKAMLNKGLRLPPEIIDQIVEKAEYWPHTSSYVHYDPSLNVAGHSLHDHDAPEDAFLIRTPPLGFPRFPFQSLSSKDISRTEVVPKPPGRPLPPGAFQTLIGSPEAPLTHPCRKIAFTILSRDQGWGGLGTDHLTYRGSWTWFEAGLERWCQESEDEQPPPTLSLNNVCTLYPEVVEADGLFDITHPLQPIEKLKIQCNETASMHIKEHRVEWRYTDDIDPESNEAGAAELAAQGRGMGTGDGKFVRELQVGDMVTVWARARFPGWINHIESVKVDVYWAL